MMAIRTAATRLRGKANDRARDILTRIIKNKPAGTKLLVDYLTERINVPDSRRNFSTRRTGRLMYERSDVRQVSPGVWEVVQ
jgi:hypothetical protein